MPPSWLCALMRAANSSCLEAISSWSCLARAGLVAIFGRFGEASPAGGRLLVSAVPLEAMSW